MRIIQHHSSWATQQSQVCCHTHYQARRPQQISLSIAPTAMCWCWERSIWTPQLTSAVTNDRQQHTSHVMIRHNQTLQPGSVTSRGRGFTLCRTQQHKQQQQATGRVGAGNPGTWTHTHMMAATVCTHQAVAAFPRSCNEIHEDSLPFSPWRSGRYKAQSVSCCRWVQLWALPARHAHLLLQSASR